MFRLDRSPTKYWLSRLSLAARAEESRWAAQREARARLARQPDDGIQIPYSRGEFERLAAQRDETDQMFLAE